MTALPAPDDLGIRLLMARTGISREDATVMWYAKELLEACRSARDHLREERKNKITHPIGQCPVLDFVEAAIDKAEGARPEEG